MQIHKNIKLHNIKSDKMIKENGYFINPYSFKELGGSDIFFVSVLEKIYEDNNITINFRWIIFKHGKSYFRS